MDTFVPPPLLRNQHLQSLLATVKIRRPALRRRARPMIERSSAHVLDCGSGVRLHGYHSGHGDGEARDLVILIHGWEGSADSLYLLSSAQHLFTRGMDVFRLHLRDHGPSHALNEGLFNACLIDEVVNAVARVEQQFPHRRLFLAGFSMGGNFALRIALRAPAKNIGLSRAVAVCPLVNPQRSMQCIEDGWFGYRRYFVRKWKRSLDIKARAFPHLLNRAVMEELESLSDLTEYFVAHHTHFADTTEYFNGYRVIGDVLDNLSVPTVVYASRDDPVIPVDDMAKLGSSRALDIRLQPYGGHCGFIQDFRLTSWIDRQLARDFGVTDLPITRRQ